MSAIEKGSARDMVVRVIEAMIPPHGRQRRIHTIVREDTSLALEIIVELHRHGIRVTPADLRDLVFLYTRDPRAVYGAVDALIQLGVEPDLSTFGAACDEGHLHLVALLAPHVDLTRVNIGTIQTLFKDICLYNGPDLLLLVQHLVASNYPIKKLSFKGHNLLEHIIQKMFLDVDEYTVIDCTGDEITPIKRVVLFLLAQGLSVRSYLRYDLANHYPECDGELFIE